MVEINPRICSVVGCINKGQHLGKYYKTGDRAGQPMRRDKCGKHHFIQYDINGWEYKKYRKEYCENIDSRLGFKCTTTIIDTSYQLEVDHIDEDHSNNNIDNLQTLCACCHRLKTKYYRVNDTTALDFMYETIGSRGSTG